VRALLSPSVEVAWVVSKRADLVETEVRTDRPLVRAESALVFTPLACRWAAASRSGFG
jgi:hypothetical protein